MTTLTKDEMLRLARESGVNTNPDIIAVFETFATLCRALPLETL